MTDATVITAPLSTARAVPEQAPPLRLPGTQPLGVPVLIHDAVTPLGGETLLALLMKRLMRKDQP